VSEERKPVHAKPSLYAYYFIGMKEIALAYGYNLVLHGSMARDLDLIAIPWTDTPEPELEMIHKLSEYITGYKAAEGNEKDIYLMKNLPGGRHSYVINVNRGGYKNMEKEAPDFVPDPQYYIDISVTPLGKAG